MNTISADKVESQRPAASLELFKATPVVWITRLPQSAIRGISFAMALLVGVADYWTGLDVSVAFLYLAPIGLGTWFAGRRTGLLLAGASALVWLTADLLLRTSLHPLLVPVWNTLALAIVFGAVAWLLGAIKGQNERLELAVRQRTESLRAEIDERIHTEQQLRETNANLVAIRHLHEKIDHLLRKQSQRLFEIQQIQLDLMRELAGVLPRGNQPPSTVVPPDSVR